MSDAMLEAGWPTHWALYRGRTREEIIHELLPIERRLLMDRPNKGDGQAYARLVRELAMHPYDMDIDAQHAAAIYAFEEIFRSDASGKEGE